MGDISFILRQFGSSIAVAECRHVSLYIAPGGKIFVYFYSVRKSDRPFVRPPSDLETKTRRALALSSGVILIEHAAADLLVVVVFVLYYRLFTSRGKKPAAIYEPDRTLDVRPAKRDKYVCRSAREGIPQISSLLMDQSGCGPPRRRGRS